MFIRQLKDAMSKMKSIVSQQSQHVKVDVYTDKYFTFPDVDENGKRILKIWKMNVSNMPGQQGIIAQQKLSNMSIGEQVVLEASETTPDLCSVKIKSTDGVQIGWLKNGQTLEDHNYKYDVYSRLVSGITVLAKISDKELTKSGKFTIKIEVARYAK